jgi:hypothetical protein
VTATTWLGRFPLGEWHINLGGLNVMIRPKSVRFFFVACKPFPGPGFQGEKK